MTFERSGQSQPFLSHRIVSGKVAVEDLVMAAIIKAGHTAFIMLITDTL